jgi:hypothetical protein
MSTVTRNITLAMDITSENFRLLNNLLCGDWKLVAHELVMDATVGNFQILKDLVEERGWKVKGITHFSSNPKAGEVWKDGDGNSFKLCSIGMAEPDYMLCADENPSKTWRANGWWNDHAWNPWNLVERVSECVIPPIKIKDGEYWMDGFGDVHLVTVDQVNEKGYAVRDTKSNSSWTIEGLYYVNGCNTYKRDLVKRLEIVFDPHNKGNQNV